MTFLKKETKVLFQQGQFALVFRKDEGRISSSNPFVLIVWSFLWFTILAAEGESKFKPKLYFIDLLFTGEKSEYR
jgi:hypothetical protein